VLNDEVNIAKEIVIETKSLSKVSINLARSRGFELEPASMRKMTVIISPVV
jgi:hypothetical protein